MDMVFETLSSDRPMKTYTISSGDSTLAYGSKSTSYIVGMIEADDELYVSDITMDDGWAYLSYSSSRLRKNAYIPLSVICENNKVPCYVKATGSIAIYKRSNTEEPYGKISSGDIFVAVAQNADFVQVVYPFCGAYMLGWIDNADYNACVGVNPLPSSFMPELVL
ncbi:MAG: hypothetical protein FWG40_06865 [Peptococcaceae bacterium]|nr:hypothetical protein [Peptococcaceae bacterium]